MRGAMPDPGAPHSSSKPFAPDQVAGDYEIKTELGRGGMGVVYRARQILLNRIVALKILTNDYGPDEVAQFLAEGQTVAGLHHPNILEIYEVGEIEGAPFFSMEFVESGSLADQLRTGPIDERDAALVSIGVARAVDYAHRKGVVHRNLKPANILLDPNDVPKIADFAIATSRDVGAAADVYSLGAILYEMLAGRPPFLSDAVSPAF